MGIFKGGSMVMGVTPTAGWCISWKIPSINGWWLGVPPFQETTNFIRGNGNGRFPWNFQASIYEQKDIYHGLSISKNSGRHSTYNMWYRHNAIITRMVIKHRKSEGCLLPKSREFTTWEWYSPQIGRGVGKSKVDIINLVGNITACDMNSQQHKYLWIAI